MAFLHAGIDGGCVECAAFGAAGEPRGRILLQQAERETAGQQVRLEPCAVRISIGLACFGGDRGQRGKGLRCVQVVEQSGFDGFGNRADLGIDADEIANRIFDGMRRGDPHILTHPEAKRFWRMKRLLPYPLYLALMRRQLARVAARMQRKTAAT